MFLLMLALLLLLGRRLLWLTQPLFSRPQPNSVRTVDPARLEAHVRKLAIELAPRDVGHIENLDRAASYIGAPPRRCRFIRSVRRV